MLRQPFCGLENPNWGFLESKQGKYIINFFILNQLKVDCTELLQIDSLCNMFVVLVIDIQLTISL